MSYIMDKVNEARRLFMIDSYPGDFFEFINETNYTKRYGLLLFKEDIGKLSGFIGYGAGELTLICVNYKRPIGHQNFTLAHELGHWFLHKGQSFSDELLNISMNGKNRESEANQFAIELLYPHNCFIDDCKVIEAEDLLHEVYRKKLGEYIDLLCHRYCLSYAVVLRKVLGHYNLFSEYEQIRKEIEKALGGKVSQCFERDFYLANEELPMYQPMDAPYQELKERVTLLVAQDKISEATGESILLRNGLLE